MCAKPITTATLHNSKQVDTNPRYRYDNILATELDMPEKTTQEYSGPGMKSRLDAVLSMDINGDDGNDVDFTFAADPIPNPYLSYEQVTGSGEDARSVRNVGGGNASAASRPKTGKKREGASRSSATSGGGGGGGGAADYNNYSSANAGGSAGAGYGGSSGASSQYYSGSSGATRSEGRPKSATRRRDDSAASGSAGGYGGRGEDMGAYRSSSGGGGASRYVPEDELYPTARGLIRK